AAEDDDALAGDASFDPELASFLAETFQLELRELLARVPEEVASLADPAQQAQVCAELARALHTVKGSAATIGRDEQRDVGGVMQDEFEPSADQSLLPLPPASLGRLAHPLEAVFLAAGLEPPIAALELASAAARSFLADPDDDGDLDEATLHEAAIPAI